MSCPAWYGPGLTPAVKPTSTEEMTVVTSFAELFAPFVSLAFATATAFETLAAALSPTATGTVIEGRGVCAAIDPARVQVTTCAAVEHAQPVPLALPGTRPAGSVSVRVIVPDDARSPMWLTSTV